MVLEMGGIAVSGGIAVTEPHQETLGSSASSAYGLWISPIEVCRGMAHQKVKLKTLEATTFPKMLSAKIVMKLKNLGAKIL